MGDSDSDKRLMALRSDIWSAVLSRMSTATTFSPKASRLTFACRTSYVKRSLHSIGRGKTKISGNLIKVVFDIHNILVMYYII